MARYTIYAVGYGIDPKTRQPVYGLKLPTWKECEQYVKGIDGAKFKGFLTDNEADAWINKTVSKVKGTTSSVSNAATASHNAVNNTSRADKQPAAHVADPNQAKSEFVDICNDVNVNPSDMLNKLIADFVSSYRLLHPVQPVGEEGDDEDYFGALPFN